MWKSISISKFRYNSYRFFFNFFYIFDIFLESQVYDPTQINFTYNLPKATSKTQYKLTFLGIIVNRLSSGYSWEKVEVSQTWKINLIPDVGGNGTSSQPVAGSNKNVGNTNNRGLSPLVGLIVGILTLFL